MIYDETTTVKDVLVAWDSGDSVWSVEMGGLGPGYEQCIQALAIELLRAKCDTPLPAKGEWEGWGDEVVSRLNKTFGFSGAQVGAAKNIAACILVQGYAKALKSAGNDRLIQVRRNIPNYVHEASNA